MADERIRQPVKITSPTTDANEAEVDASGNLQVLTAAIVPGVGVTNLGKAEDQLSATGDVGVAAMVIRDDVLSALPVDAELDYTNLRVNANGALWTQDVGVDAALAGSELQVDLVDGNVTNAGTFLVQEDGPALTALQLIDDMMEVDNAAVSVGGGVAMVGLVFDDTTPVVITEGDAGYQRMSADREAYVVTRDAAGNERGANVTASNELNVIASAQPGVDIGDVDVLSLPTIVTLADEVDNAAVSVGGGLLMGGLVFDDTTPVVVTEGDAGYQRMSADREAYTVTRDAAGNERGANVTASNELNVIASAQPGVDIGDVDVLSVIPGVGATNLGKAGDAAAATTDTMVAVAAIRDDALTTLSPTLDGEYTQLRVNSTGALHVTGGGGGTEYTEDDAAPANPVASAQSLIRLDTPAALTTADNDIVTRRGTDFGAAYTQIVTSTGSYVDAFGSAAAPAGEAAAHSSSTDTAAAATFDADSADFGTATKKLTGVDVWASVPYKATIMSVSDNSETILDVIGGRAGEHLAWRPVDKDYFEVAFTANAGFDGFRCEITNLDNSQAADLYGTVYSED